MVTGETGACEDNKNSYKVGVIFTGDFRQVLLYCLRSFCGNWDTVLWALATAALLLSPRTRSMKARVLLGLRVP